MSTTVTWNGTSYSIPASGELNWSALSNFLVDLGQHAAATTFDKRNMRVATTSPVTVSASTDTVVLTHLGTPGAVAVNLPAGADGQMFYIGDQLGDAATNNITINRNGSDTINGATTYVIKDNYGGVILAYAATNTQWNVVGRFTSGVVLVNPMATTGDMIYGGASGVATNLATGATAGVLHGGNAAVPSWSQVVNADISTSAAIARSKVAAGTASHVLINDGSGNVSSEATLAVSRGGTNLASGTSGGVLAYTASGTLASSGALTANGVVLGGGAGAVPTVTAAGTNGQLLVGVTSGAPAWGSSVSAATTFSGLMTASGGINRTGDDGISAYSSTDQGSFTISGSGSQAISIGTTLFDVTSAFSSSTYTCKIAGNYVITFRGSIDRTGGTAVAGDQVIPMIKKNGSLIGKGLTFDAADLLTNQWIPFCMTAGATLAVNDTITFTVDANTGSSRTVTADFRGAQITIQRL